MRRKFWTCIACGMLLNVFLISSCVFRELKERRENEGNPVRKLGTKDGINFYKVYDGAKWHITSQPNEKSVHSN